MDNWLEVRNRENLPISYIIFHGAIVTVGDLVAWNDDESLKDQSLGLVLELGYGGKGICVWWFCNIGINRPFQLWYPECLVNREIKVLS